MAKDHGDKIPPFSRRHSLVRFPASVQDENSHRGRVAFIFCPVNFPYDNRQPSQNESVRFEVANALEMKDASLGIGAEETNGVKVISLEGEFMGWVRTMDKHVLLSRLEKGHRVNGFVSEGYISSWVRGGGDCVSGQVYFQDETMIGHRRAEEKKAIEQEAKAKAELDKDRVLEEAEFGYYLDDIETDNSDYYTNDCFSPPAVKRERSQGEHDDTLVFTRFRILSSDKASADERIGIENQIGDTDVEKKENVNIPAGGIPGGKKRMLTDTMILGPVASPNTQIQPNDDVHVDKENGDTETHTVARGTKRRRL